MSRRIKYSISLFLCNALKVAVATVFALFGVIMICILLGVFFFPDVLKAIAA